MPWSLSLTVTSRSLYAVTAVGVFVVCDPGCIGTGGGGGSVEPLACAATWAHDVRVVLTPLKFAVLSDVVPSPMELLTAVTSL